MMNRYLLVLIFLLALILRFYNLGNYPALNADEAALGYNAYSLLQTGKDEHGTPWPLHFQSFNDYKPGLTAYLIMPFVGLLGLNEWSVRILPAFIGALTVVALYYFVKDLREQKLEVKYSSMEIIASMMLAISPWHIHFSRGAWEVNIATFLMLTGALFFIKANKNNAKYYYVSAILFVLSLYTYHSARIIAPLIVLGLICWQFRSVIKNYKAFVFAGVFGLLILVPLAIDFLGPAGISRASGVSLLADSGPVNRINEQRGQHINTDGLVEKFMHNKAINYGLEFVHNWSEHYWGEFLFLSGDDIQRNKVPETGQMYLFDIVLIALGLIFIARKSKGWTFIIWWLLIAPVAAAATFQSPHALRSQNMVIPLIIISAYGLTILLHLIKLHVTKDIARITSYLLLTTLIFLGFARYLLMYYGHMAKEYPFSSQYGVKELVSFLQSRNEDKVIVTDRYDQPYILFLFYIKYPPAIFQQQHELTQRDIYGFSTVRSFDKYEFRSIKFDEDRPLYPNTLLVGTDEEIPDEANIIKEIQFPNGKPAFQIMLN